MEGWGTTCIFFCLVEILIPLDLINVLLLDKAKFDVEFGCLHHPTVVSPYNCVLVTSVLGV